MGGGRSGSTLMDVVLGNNPGILSCGELRRFTTKRGRIESRFPGDPCIDFWSRFKDGLEHRLGDLDFEYLDRLTRRVEYHTRFLFPRTYVSTSALMQEYHEYVRVFLDVLFESVKETTIVDSSKYPGRALALYRLLDIPVKVIWLVRHPVGVVRSFAKRGIEQPRKGFFAANMFYGVNSMLCTGVYHAIDQNDRVRIRYEDLVREPVKTMRVIESAFGLDLGHSNHLLESGAPLNVGCLIGGNRLRKRKEVALHRGEVRYGWGLPEITTRIMNRIWY